MLANLRVPFLCVIWILRKICEHSQTLAKLQEIGPWAAANTSVSMSREKDKFMKTVEQKKVRTLIAVTYQAAELARICWNSCPLARQLSPT